MSAPVDVLAVLDRTNEALLHGDPAPSLADLKEARAAVAELIAAAERLIDSANPELSGWAETVNALARVRGAA